MSNNFTPQMSHKRGLLTGTLLAHGATERVWVVPETTPFLKPRAYMHSNMYDAEMTIWIAIKR